MSEAREADSLAAYEDFLERYVDYRLKVLEAEAIGLDSDDEIQQEIDGYRRQYARPYLLDRAVLLPLMRQLYERQQEAIDVSHILLTVQNGASPADTLALYTQAAAIADSARAGADFGDLARRHSTDPSANDERRGPGFEGRLGYITGGTTVRPFEDAAWVTPVGAISDPVRTNYGYHVVMVHARRPTPADIRIAHIMVTPRGATQADTAAALARVDSVVTELGTGADFADLAATYSDDRQSADRGGDLGVISFGSRFVQEMKEVAFAMDEVGSVSDPVKTAYGFHLIKLAERIDRPTFEESYDALKQQAARLPEAIIREHAFADSILVLRSATIDSAVVIDRLAGYTADSLSTLADLPAEWDTLVVATLQDSSYTLSSFAGRAPWARYALVRDMSHVEVVDAVTQDFMREAAIAYETYVLEGRDAEFARTIREFRNGILLFNLMEDSVWTAASTDSAAIQAIYDEDPLKYMYPDRTVIVSVFSRSNELVTAAAALMLSGLDPDAAMDSLNAAGALTIDTTHVAGLSNSVYDRAFSTPEGQFAAPVSYNNGFIALKRAGIEPARPKTLDEARAEIVSELQERLERRLVARLRQKYEARTYPDRLREMLDPDPTTAANQ
jgi:peptidyl-prolyl cis-trans isomerase SurA